MNITYKTSFFAVLALLVAFASFGQAQTTLPSTTTSTAITASQKVFSVASATGFSGPLLAQSQGGVGSSTVANQTVVLVDREIMDIVSVTGTSITVRRGTRGTAAVAHNSGAKATVGPAGNFADSDQFGACTRSVLAYVPFINTKTGEAFDCVNSLWAGYRGRSVGANIASASTVAPIGHVTHITGTTAINTITVPPFCPANGCVIYFVPNAAYTLGTSGNVAIASTGAVGQVQTLVYDAGTSKWYPSY